MRLVYFLTAFLVSSFNALSQETKSYDPNDLDALRTLAVKWERYWNSHNMDSMGTVLRKDVDFVNVAGVWLKGKEATVNDHKQKHQGIVFKNSVWTTGGVQIKYVKPDLAIMHIDWSIKGDK